MGDTPARAPDGEPRHRGGGDLFVAGVLRVFADVAFALGTLDAVSSDVGSRFRSSTSFFRPLARLLARRAASPMTRIVLPETSS